MPYLQVSISISVVFQFVIFAYIITNTAAAVMSVSSKCIRFWVGKICCQRLDTGSKYTNSFVIKMKSFRIGLASQRHTIRHIKVHNIMQIFMLITDHFSSLIASNKQFLRVKFFSVIFN